MKIVVFKGFAPISFSGEWGDCVLLGNGHLNRIDAELWNAIYAQYKNAIDDFISSGVMEVAKSKDKETKEDQEVKADAVKAVQEKQKADQEKGAKEALNKAKKA